MYAIIIREVENVIAEASLSVPVFPMDYKGSTGKAKSFVRYQLLFPDSDLISYSKDKQFNATLFFDIFTQSGRGHLDSALISAELDNVFEFSCLPCGAQLLQSSFSLLGLDKDNNSLSRAEYRVPLKFYGASQWLSPVLSLQVT